MCPRCEGRGSVTDFDLSALYDESKSLNEGALTIPGYSMDGWYGRIFGGCGCFDPDKPIRSFTKEQLHDPKVDAVQGRRGAAAAHPGLRGTAGDVHDVPGVRRDPAQPGGPGVEDRGGEHRRRVCDADHRPGRVGAGSRGAVRGAAARGAAADPGLVRRDRAGLPLARPPVGQRSPAARRSGRR
jgi:hypothetical protein